jgi:hypothetical protein
VANGIRAFNDAIKTMEGGFDGGRRIRATNDTTAKEQQRADLAVDYLSEAKRFAKHAMDLVRMLGEG